MCRVPKEIGRNRPEIIHDFWRNSRRLVAVTSASPKAVVMASSIIVSIINRWGV